MPTPSETIARLHTKIVDAANGYEDAKDIGTLASVAELCADLRRIHLAHAHELSGLLLARGERADGDGSFMSLVHKAVINVRFAFTADEKSLLPGLRDGEKRLLEAYDDALRECEIAVDAFTPAESGTIKTQRDVVVTNIGRIDTLKEAAA